MRPNGFHAIAIITASFALSLTLDNLRVRDATRTSHVEKGAVVPPFVLTEVAGPQLAVRSRTSRANRRGLYRHHPAFEDNSSRLDRLILKSERDRTHSKRHHRQSPSSTSESLGAGTNDSGGPSANPDSTPKGWMNSMLHKAQPGQTSRSSTEDAGNSNQVSGTSTVPKPRKQWPHSRLKKSGAGSTTESSETGTDETGTAKHEKEN